MRIKSLVVTACMALMATTLLAQNVTFDFDKSADFKRFKTYAWVRGTVLADQFNHARVVKAIDSQLTQRGLAEVPATAGPDVLVAYHASFDRDLQISGFSTGWGPYRFGPGASAMARTEEILVGTLAVDIVDARTKTIVWRAVAVKDVNVNAKPDEREKNISRATAKMFKSYPATTR
jgi:hypothetical protein